ncbi:hypothetical protein GCM10022288_05570 [Gryllotalpicola kribbensis]|uniref:DUF559 domain-containing protein n=1 Tax=Gryllotalpicola kribbensis TaxID=993084 RepID=A0ABP8AIM3_9MICO
MTGAWAFSGVTAAALHGVPLPPALDSKYRALDVAVPDPRSAPRADGIIGHRYDADSVKVVFLAGLPVMWSPDAWCQLAAVISREDLVAAGDFLLSGDAWEGARRRPRCTIGQLSDAVRRYAGKRGARNLRWALSRLRPGVDSRPESLLRLLLVEAGVPEPVVHQAIDVADGAITLHPDLVLVALGVVFEYQGDGHRGRDRYLSDIERNELLRAAGWDVIEVTARDLFEDREAFLARVFAILRRHGFRAN